MNPTALLTFAAALAASAAAQPPSPPPAADWQPLSKSRGPLSLAWDRAGTVRRGDVVELVVRATADFGPKPRHGDFLTEIRCGDRRVRVIRTTNYAADGTPLVEDHPKAKFFAIKAKTYYETIRAAVC